MPGAALERAWGLACARVGAVFPLACAPVIVLNKIAEGLTRRDSWVDRVEVYDAYLESPYHRLAEVLKSLGLGNERVGLEKNYVSAAHWEEIQQRLQLVGPS